MIRGIHHVAIATENLDTMLDFYVGLLGCEIVVRYDWDKGSHEADVVVGLKDSSTRHAMIKAGNAYIELFQYLTPPGRPPIRNRPVNDCGLTHICFDVVGVEAEYERLKAAGVYFNGPPQVLGGMVHTIYGRDPEGNVFEIQEIIDPSVDFLMVEFSGDNQRPD
ncbi:VOC family protein [Sphingobium chungbukense]|uniref:VOC domain-containing protein n=1 Tax=Sphingobium chungbukense TaxID=56193 RepID=A0A0M3AMG6_9SPHN|nr:VOC family protein [Sphingobium chungbukense]KKW90131.1 hypothetical protein YP76_22100 [Sphingobium chungbukense]